MNRAWSQKHQLLKDGLLIQARSAEPTNVVVTVGDELDASSITHFERIVDDACGSLCRSLTVDLTGCRYIDSSVISALIRLTKRFENLEVLVAPAGAVHKVFDICGFINARNTFVRVAGKHEH